MKLNRTIALVVVILLAAGTLVGCGGKPVLAATVGDQEVTVTQLENSVGAVANLAFTDDELDAIDRHAVEGGINLWKGPSRA